MKRSLVRAVPVLTACALAAAAAATTPALIWRGAARVNVQCLVQPTTPANAELQRRICEHARARAAGGSPVPVEIVALGDPKVLAADSVTLLVHASVRPSGGRRLLAFSVRSFRTAADHAAPLYGAAPRAVLLPARGATAPDLDAAIAAALSETLPWSARPSSIPNQ